MDSTDLGPWEPLVAAIVDRVAKQVTAELRRSLALEPTADWVDAKHSPLGKVRHGRAAKRRIELGLGGAGKVGRRWLLSREALAEELALAALESPEDRAAAELRQDLAELSAVASDRE